jgi:hypothetical protein
VKALTYCLECRCVCYAEGYRFSVPWGTECRCPPDPELDAFFNSLTEKERASLRSGLVNWIYRNAMRERGETED